MLLRLPLAIVCGATLAVATLATAAPTSPPVTDGDDTVSSAVVDDRGPEDLPVRKPAARPSPTEAPNPLRPAAAKPAAEPKETAAAKDAKGADAKEEANGEGDAAAAKNEGCGRAGCTSCVRKVPVCKPKWEDKKTKRPVFSMKCEWECVRPWEPYCQGACCEEKTTPCAGVYTKKRLYKTDEERCERVLKYEMEMKPAGDCCNAAPVRDCMGCRILGETVHHLLSRCHH